MDMSSSSAAQNNDLALENETGKCRQRGTTCHQCRQRKSEVMASCTSVKNNRRCLIKICNRCLLNRYPETVEEVEAPGDWVCPKCRDDCNCSVCRRKKNLKPTGQLARVARTKGFNSVSEMLSVEGLGEQFSPHNGAMDASTSSSKGSDREEVDREVPPGTSVETIAGIDLAPEDVGNALQFLQFCETFEEVLNFQKSDAESVLRELSGRGSGRPKEYSSAIRCQANLLSLINPLCTSNDSWFENLGKSISESASCEYVLKELPSDDCFSKGDDGYDMLNFSQKLRLLRFLCDEALSSSTLRGWIDQQNEISAERKREAKQKLTAAKEKEKHIQQKLQGQWDEREEMRNADNADPVSISVHNSIVAGVERELNEAHAEVVEATAMVPKGWPEALRIEPCHLDDDGHAFWKLKGLTDEDGVLRQDTGTRDAGPLEEKWFFYGADMKEQIEKYLTSLSLREKKEPRSKRRSEIPPESMEEEDIRPEQIESP